MQQRKGWSFLELTLDSYGSQYGKQSFYFQPISFVLHSCGWIAYLNGRGRSNVLGENGGRHYDLEVDRYFPK